MQNPGYLLFPIELLKNFDLMWSFLLIVVRFTAMMLVMPGLGGGMAGMRVRLPAVLIMGYASSLRGPHADLPSDYVTLCTSLGSEVILGMLLGMLPAMVIAGVQTAAQLATTTMGLGAASLFDPTMNTSVSALGRLLGDLLICIFLTIGGHHAVIYAAAGLGGTIVPGTFLVSESTIAMFIERVGAIFVAGAMISAPVVVAILLTNFVMGLVSRAVPQVNIFIINFPLTIGIGLVLSILSLPELVQLIDRDFVNIEQQIFVVAEGTERVQPAEPEAAAAPSAR